MSRKCLFHGNKIEYQISTFFYIYYDSYENIYKPYGKSKMWKSNYTVSINISEKSES